MLFGIVFYILYAIRVIPAQFDHCLESGLRLTIDRLKSVRGVTAVQSAMATWNGGDEALDLEMECEEEWETYSFSSREAEFSSSGAKASLMQGAM